MILDSKNAAAVRRMALQGGTLNGVLDRISGFSLSGLMELFASYKAGVDHGLTEEVERYISSPTGILIALAGTRWREGNLQTNGTDAHRVRRLEFYRIQNREDQTSLAFELFQERFVRGLQQHGFDRSFAYALAGAMSEMTDNVVQHSEPGGAGFRGLAAYHLEHEYMAFAVVDIGQGVLGSLRHSPRWNHISTAAGALEAAICKHASSRPDQPYGCGFRDLFKALSERNCRLSFRSDDAALTLTDAGGSDSADVARSTFLAGFQVSVCCSIRGPAYEQTITKLDSLTEMGE